MALPASENIARLSGDKKELFAAVEKSSKTYNDYLLYEEPLSLEEGVRKNDDFLGY
jgi:hypothetical protein